MQGARCGLRDAGCQKGAVRSRLPEAGCQKQAAKSGLPEAGRQRLRSADGNEPVISRERKKCMTMYEEELNYWSQQSCLWRKLEGKTVLISGSSGMVGKCLTELLLRHPGIRVIAVSRKEQTARKRLESCWDSEYFQYVPCDINQPIPECGNVDYVIHAASNTHPRLYSGDPVGTIASNVFGTRNLWEYGISHKMRQFCFLSSVEVYGENRGDREKFDESYLGYLDCNTLRAGYPESKRLGEALCNAYQEITGIDFVIPRLSRVYGPTMLASDSKAISQFMKKAAMGEDIVLKSAGNQKYSYTFVTDAAAGILYTMAMGKPGEAYNIVDEESDITLRDLAEKLAEISGSRVIWELPEERESKGYSTATKAMLDGRKLAGLGWRARVHMDEGLLATIQLWRGQGSV